MSDLTDTLLDAQVAYLMTQLEGPRLDTLLREEIDAALTSASQLTLASVVTREQIKDVARKYAVSMSIPGSIPELANEIADRIYSHRAQDDHRLGDVVAAKHVEAFTTKFLELPLVQERLLQSPLMLEVVSEWLYRIGADFAQFNQQMAGRIPGMSGLLGAGTSLLGKVAPDARVEFDTRLRALAEQTAKLALGRAQVAGFSTEDPWVHDTVVESYRRQSEQPIGSLRDYVTQEDMEDLLILLYDFWLSLRETDYIHALIDEGVDFFFDKYASMTLLGLLEEFGIGREDLVEEAERFGPPVIELLRENGMLAAFLRRRLAPFWADPATQALLPEA